MFRRLALFSCRQYVFAAFVVALSLLDPFGLSSSSDNASARWLNRVIASIYPSTGQQKIAVIVIDDAYVQRNDTYWPMPYNEQSKLLKRLLAYKPKAVFVDLMYTHDHSAGDPVQGSQLLANVLERYRHQGIPVSLANSGQVRGEGGQVNTLPRLAAVSTPALVMWSGVGENYPLAVETPLGILETPAFLLYRQYCETHACADLPSDDRAAVKAPPIAIQWGLKMAPEQNQIADLAPCATSGGFVIEALKELARAVFWKLGDLSQSRCAYSLKLSASDLEVTTTEGQALISKLLNDRFVLIGADITSTGDLVQSPVHGQLPGVYLHAMALDNLISYGMGYDRDPGNLFFDFNSLDLIEIALLGLIVHLKELQERRSRTVAAYRTWEIYLFYSPYRSWALVMVILLLVTLALWLSHITPVNVLGIAALSLMLFSERVKAFFAKGDCNFTTFISRFKGAQG